MFFLSDIFQNVRYHSLWAIAANKSPVITTMSNPVNVNSSSTVDAMEILITLNSKMNAIFDAFAPDQRTRVRDRPRWHGIFTTIIRRNVNPFSIKVQRVTVTVSSLDHSVRKCVNRWRPSVRPDLISADDATERLHLQCITMISLAENVHNFHTRAVVEVKTSSLHLRDAKSRVMDGTLLQLPRSRTSVSSNPWPDRVAKLPSVTTTTSPLNDVFHLPTRGAAEMETISRQKSPAIQRVETGTLLLPRTLQKLPQLPPPWKLLP